ncbi:MAG TPA: ABC transporter ATP-binding protein [Thermodesulfobacteriota bacterium]|nr:ABC transporter ATP-binding protein [Thermodesulfobacteriota bacterium]
MPLLEVKGLTKYFGGLTAVNTLDFSVEKGEIVGLIGPNGAGKTTVFNLIMGTYAPSKGKILFKGKDITGQKSHTIVSRGLVRSFQKTILFGEMSVLENILLGFHLISEIRFWNSLFNGGATRIRQKRLLSKALEIAEFMGLEQSKDQLARNLPHGYQRMLGVAIALATNPELILMDEPVTGMNTEETDRMMNKIQAIRDRGVTTLVVEHDMRLVMNTCDRLCVLNFGSMIAEGSPSEICKHKEVIAAYLGSEYASAC